MINLTTSTVEAISVQHLEVITHSNGLAKRVSPIAERIIPFVEHYRSGRTVMRPVIPIAKIKEIWMAS